MDDGGLFSFATILLGFWLLVFLGAGGIFIYLYATKEDQKQRDQEQDKIL